MSVRLKDGGPAFGGMRRIHRQGYATNDFEPVDGMSLRQWYAAHAPAVPEWFRCEFDELVPKVPPVPIHWTAELRSDFALLREGGIEAAGAHEDVREFWKLYEPARARLDAWRNRMREKKFFKWRWHYADMMLETEK